MILFSAHWVTGVQQVSGVTEYDTIYDFGGFPDELYQIRYPAKGDRQIAHRIAERLMKDGIASEVDPTCGLGHGAWIILRLLYPNADVPVISMSVNPRLSAERLGTAI